MCLQRNDGTTSKCLGSLVTSTFILTAAHCFKFGDTPDRITVDMDSKGNNILYPQLYYKGYFPLPGFLQLIKYNSVHLINGFPF